MNNLLRIVLMFMSFTGYAAASVEASIPKPRWMGFSRKGFLIWIHDGGLVIGNTLLENFCHKNQTNSIPETAR